jgi:superfamily II DNA or RNA helicase
VTLQIFQWEEIRKDWPNWSQAIQNQTLFLEPHQAYPAYFLVNCIDPTYISTFSDVIGEYRSIHMLKVDKLYGAAEEEDYRIVFIGTPQRMLDAIERMDDPYPCELNVELKKFQRRGFNLLRKERAQVLDWSTGVGKSVLAVAMAKYLLETNQVDKVVIASRGHNKVSWQRQFARIGSLEAVIPRGKGAGPKKLEELGLSLADYQRQQRAQIYENSPIFIINYEKFRFKLKYNRETKEWVENSRDGDGEELLAALKNKRVYFIWDEMPVKMSSTTTLHYQGASKIVTKTKDKWASMLSATPIERIPEGVYGCLKILDKTRFKNKETFRKLYAKRMSPWLKWKVDVWDKDKLGELGMRLSDITHTADKYRDPEIRAEFPEEHWETIEIEMAEPDWKIYQWVDNKEVLSTDALSKLLVLQTICNNPAWLKYVDSQLALDTIEKFRPTDQYAEKPKVLRDLITSVDAKIVLFSMYNTLGSRRLAELLLKWNVPYVLYDGSDTKMQAAIDRFQTDDSIKVFVSSDLGSDSINLEAGSVVINYDLPYNYSRLVQRVNRINRITSTFNHVFYYNFVMVGTMEERKVEIIEEKKALDTAAFRMDIADVGEVLAAAQREELLYLLSRRHAVN